MTQIQICGTHQHSEPCILFALNYLIILKNLLMNDVNWLLPCYDARGCLFDKILLGFVITLTF